MVGGSSSVNGAYFLHPRAADVARWEERTGGAWDDAVVRRLRVRLERDLDLGDRDGHGTDGPVPLSRDAAHSVVTEAFVAACVAEGHPTVDDLNGVADHGVGVVVQNVSDGHRVDIATAYLAELRDDPGLTLVPDLLATRLVLEGGRVVGAELTGAARATVVRAEQVVVAGGAVGTPELLWRSGIGPAATLADLGVAPLVELPGVGAVVSNHPCVELMYRPRPGVVDRSARSFLHAALHVDGYEVLATRLPYGRVTGTDPSDALLSLRVTLMDAAGRGRLVVRDGAVEVVHDPVEHPLDRAALRDAVRATCRLAASPEWRPLVAQWFGPTPAELADDDRLDRWLRTHTGFAFHPGSTCPVGPAPQDGDVVDAQLRVHGVDGLRLADTSVLPAPSSRGPAASAVLLGELAADLLST